MRYNLLTKNYTINLIGGLDLFFYSFDNLTRVNLLVEVKAYTCDLHYNKLNYINID